MWKGKEVLLDPVQAVCLLQPHLQLDRASGSRETRSAPTAHLISASALSAKDADVSVWETSVTKSPFTFQLCSQAPWLRILSLSFSSILISMRFVKENLVKPLLPPPECFHFLKSTLARGFLYIFLPHYHAIFKATYLSCWIHKFFKNQQMDMWYNT